MSTTPVLGLALPNPGDVNWNVPLNGNFALLDKFLGGGSALPAGLILPSTLIVAALQRYTLVFSNPSSPRQITFGDPNADDSVCYLQAAQTLAGKTLNAAVLNNPALVSPTTTGTDAGVATLKNKSLIGGGNKLSLLNFQGPSNNVIGNGSARPFYTYTLPANTVSVGSALRIKWGFIHSVGTASVNYQLFVNGQAVGGVVSTSLVGSCAETIIQAASPITAAGFNTGGFGAMSTWVGQLLQTSGFAWGSNQVIQATLNVAASDQVSPMFFMVELIQ